MVFKQQDLDQRVQYDKYPRKSLLDLFYDNDATLAAVAAGTAAVRGDFLNAPYEARIRRNPDRIQVQLIREGDVGGTTVRITKGLTLDAGSATLEIAYLLENLPADRPLHFAVEFNFAGLPAGADDRYFHDLDGNRLGQLGARWTSATPPGWASATSGWGSTPCCGPRGRRASGPSPSRRSASRRAASSWSINRPWCSRIGSLFPSAKAAGS